MPAVKEQLDELVHSPVFVDSSGRRRRWVAWALGAAALVCLSYVVLLGLSVLGGPVTPGGLVPWPAAPKTSGPKPTATDATTSKAPAGSGPAGTWGTTGAPSGPTSGPGGAPTPGTTPSAALPGGASATPSLCRDDLGRNVPVVVARAVTDDPAHSPRPDAVGASPLGDGVPRRLGHPPQAASESRFVRRAERGHRAGVPARTHWPALIVVLVSFAAALALHGFVTGELANAGYVAPPGPAGRVPERIVDGGPIIGGRGERSRAPLCHDTR